jgi:acetoin utilization deacetylase AcuC-like enzyme
MRVALYGHPVCEQHDMGAGHPEQPDRIRVCQRLLASSGLLEKLEWRQAPRVEQHRLLAVHSADHVRAVFEVAPETGRVSLDPDTAMNPYSLDAARRAAGANVAAVEAVLAGEIDRAFCLVRPPGHHAEHQRVMGFCFFNNVACAAAAALEAGLERVAILDFDVHHGNGTEDIFREDSRVLLCSSFQHPFYPMTPLSKRSHLIHSPLSSGSGGEALRQAVTEQWWPAVDAFEPQLILVSAGFDGHRQDPLAGLNFTDEDYRWVTEQIVAMADKHASGRLVSTLEGGYDLEALSRCVVEHVEGLL